MLPYQHLFTDVLQPVVSYLSRSGTYNIDQRFSSLAIFHDKNQLSQFDQPTIDSFDLARNLRSSMAMKCRQDEVTDSRNLRLDDLSVLIHSVSDMIGYARDEKIYGFNHYNGYSHDFIINYKLFKSITPTWLNLRLIH